MNFDIIITTYNRPKLILSLIEQIWSCNKPLPNQIIVVDSSDEINVEIQKLEKVNYIHSSHKNQPYQRYLGYKCSSSEIIVFLDDDLKIINNDIFSILLLNYSGDKIVGSSVGMSNEQTEVKQTSFNKTNIFIKVFLLMTGAYPVKKGKVGLVGQVGVKDETTQYVESYSGAIMSFKTSIIEKIMNDSLLFYFFENKMAMGEDKYISMGALKYGKLSYSSEICLLHPAHESTYFQNVYSFSKKEIFSRLWLSKKYAKVKNKSSMVTYIHYYWYAWWRIITTIGDFIIHPQKNKIDKLSGKISGVFETFINWQKRANKIDWEKEIYQDIEMKNTLI